MIYSLKDLEKGTKSKDLETRTGGFNTAPPGMRELTEAEFATSLFFTYLPEQVEYRQFAWKDSTGKEYQTSFRLFHMHDGTGFAVTAEYYNHKVRWFHFGCDHDYRGCTDAEIQSNRLYTGRCYHNQICQKCGHIWSYDSSD